MSSLARRKEKVREWERERAALEAERNRKAKLSLADLIEESDASSSVKEILRRITDELAWIP